jgi:tyrosyl-tRNA synthetase
MTTPLLEGLDGVEKMSKSLGNYVGVTEAPGEMFGKLMSISDELMWRYYTLLTDLTPDQILERRGRVSSGDLHPKQAKVDLATMIVSDFHGGEEAGRAAEGFERRFARGELPDDIPVVSLSESEWRVTLERMLVRCGLANSTSEAHRMVEQGGVRINGRRVGGRDSLADFERLEADEFVLQVGKRSAVRVRRS